MNVSIRVSFLDVLSAIVFTLLLSNSTGLFTISLLVLLIYYIYFVLNHLYYILIPKNFLQSKVFHDFLLLLLRYYCIF